MMNFVTCILTRNAMIHLPITMLLLMSVDLDKTVLSGRGLLVAAQEMSTVTVPLPQSTNQMNQHEQEQQQQRHRHLEHRDTDPVLMDEDRKRIFDVFWPEHDECLNDEIVETVVVPEGDATTTTYTRTIPIYGPCNTTRFPICNPDSQFICYNRRPRQDKFYHDIHQPYFFIDYRTVFCYPSTWGGCSSCSPGRLCLNERRCILEDKYYYNCEKWI